MNSDDTASPLDDLALLDDGPVTVRYIDSDSGELVIEECHIAMSPLLLDPAMFGESRG